MDKIAKILGVNVGMIHSWIHKHDINVNKTNERLTGITFTKKATLMHKDKYDYSLVNYINSHKKVKIICPIHGEFEQYVYYHINARCGCSKCGNNLSKPEQEISEFIQSLVKTEVIQGSRNIVNPMEIDIYLPKHKLAIEYNGIYWHSEQQGKDRNYHLNKTTSCEDKGIQLLHIFDNEWLNPIKQKIWKSVIANKLNIYQNRIGARQTEIREVPNKDVNIFLEENHLQGKCGSSVKYGLYYNGNLVALMTFGKSRFSKCDWELIRFCSKLHHQVYGAASKLLSHFRKQYNGSVVSYANRRWSTGELYDKLGFDFCHNSTPNYFYWNKNSKYLLESRNKYQKHKLHEELEFFDDNLSEYKNMLNNGYDRIWDSGNKVYML